MKKRIISVVLALSLLLTLLPAKALAAEWGDLTGTVPAGLQGDPDDSVYQNRNDTDILDLDAQISPYADEETVTYTLDNGAQLTVTVSGTITGGSPGNDGAIVIPAEIPVEGSDTEETIAVTSIGGYAFFWCSGLTSITIPSSVTTIGAYAFSGCSGLTSITIPDSVTTIEQGAFSSCSGLTSITIPDSVTTIEQAAFSGCSGLTSITIPNGVTTIRDFAFSSCSGLTSIIIPDSVTTIGSQVFGSCSKLENISIGSENQTYMTLDDVLFSKDKSSVLFCPAGKSGAISLPETVTTIGDGAFGLCNGLTSIIIPDSVTTIGDRAFSGCSGLTSITIPSSVTTIEQDAFSFCSGLTSITIPDSVTTIEQGAFSSCSGLTSITIPDSVTTIGAYAFSGCRRLTSITIPNGVTTIRDFAFASCSELTSITIPNGVTTIRDCAFSGCSGLTSIIIPDSVTTIGDRAFSGCSGLTSIIIPDSVTSIGSDAFSGVNSDFVLYCYPGSYAETYAKDKNLNYQLIEISGRTLSASVLDENGSALSEGFTVTWYDENGKSVGTGAALSGADPEKSYFFAVTLENGLAASYEQPERQTITPSDAANREVRLVKKAVANTLTLFGQVNDQTGAPLSGAAVTVTPAEGDPVEAVTAADGAFSVTVPCGVVSIAIQKDGYYSKREILDLTDKTGGSYNAGTYTLAPVQAITDRLTLSVTQRWAAEDQAMAVETPLSSLGNLEVMLAGSGGRSITDFDVQGFTLLFQPGAVLANEEISITLKDPSGAYRTASTAVTLDGDRLGTAELTMVQKGGFVLGGVSGPDANLLVFDGSGNCIQTSAAVLGLTGGAMEPGTYQVVLLQKSELLRGVSALSYLDTFGLVSGRDYLLRQITVADGKITRLDNCVVPALDESRISYTIAGSTGVTSSKPSGISVGELLMIRAAYEVDINKGVSVDRLHIVLPDGIDLLEASVLIDSGTAPYTYDQTTREVCVNMSGRDKAVVMLYCTPVNSGSHSISAFLKLTNGSSQPIGAAVVLAENARLNVLERTGKAEGLTASGKTRPGSTVTLYDNDMEVGRTTANAAGSWSVSFNLAQPVYSYSYHNIHAVVTGSNLTEPITTESVLVTYDKRLNTVELAKITMYNTGDHGAQETVFDFTSSASTATPYYRMWPSRYPTFTFKAEFSGNSSMLEEVYVVTTNSAGDATYVKTTYDATSGAWVGTHNYTSFDVAPVTVTAAYSVEDDGAIPYDKEWRDDMERIFIETYQQNETMLEPILNELFNELINYTIVDKQENYMKVAMSYTDSHTGELVEFGCCQIEVTSVMDGVTFETLDDDGYVLVDSTDEIWAKIECTEMDLMLICVNLNEQTCYTTTVQLNIPAVNLGMRSMVPNEGNNLYIGEQLAQFGLTAGSLLADSPLSNALGLVTGMDGVEHTNKQWVNLLNVRLEKLVDNLWDAKMLLEKRCADGSRKLPDYAYNNLSLSLDGWEAAITDYGNYGWKYIRRMGAFDSVMNIYFTVVGAIAIQYGIIAVDGILSGWTMFDSGHKINLALGVEKDPVERYIINQYNEINSAINDIKKTIKAAYQTCDSAADTDSPTTDSAVDTDSPTTFPKAAVAQHVTYIADPSGYVYEAVPSNRLSGVTAIISSEAGGTWNAADYDQINPQTTGPDGSFYWDVPCGNWKVSLIKDGYATADTSTVAAAVNGWLPVPPPQLDINVGMVSANAPTVKSAVAYTNQVELTFSQYMDIASVQSAVSLTRDGTAASGLTVRALDAEYDAAGENQYATRFAIIPTGGDLSGSLTVSVGSGAKNYAGKPLAAAYTSPAMTAGIRPTGISGPDSVSVALHGTADVSFTLQPGIAGQTLTIESLSPALVRVGMSEATTGTDGRASVRINGELPGSGQIRITEPVSGLNKTITVFIGIDGTVMPQPEKPAQVKAALEDGTALNSGMALPAGSKIRLWTDTPDAVIRYTLNDTCPCLAEALVYSEPVAITENLILRAAAWKDGVYSDTIRLELSVKFLDTPDVPDIPDDPDGPDVPSVPVVPDSPVSPGTPGISSSFDGSDMIPGTSHTITVSSVSGGSVTVSPRTAAPGRTVTISAVPDTGYELVSLAVTDSSGKALALTDKGSGKYTFTMPNVKATVSAVFRLVQAAETPWSNPFTDIIEGAWYYEAVRFVQENGLMSGYGNGTFAPKANLSRAMLAQILYNKEGRPTITGSAFTDVVSGAWYSDAVTWAAAQGTVAGYGNVLFGPNNNITREQLAVMLWRYAGKPAANVEPSFSDTDQISDFAQTAIRWAVENRILNGKGNNILDPTGKATRAETAQMLKNYLEK